jgi:hypothetical protein
MPEHPERQIVNGPLNLNDQALQTLAVTAARFGGESFQVACHAM